MSWDNFKLRLKVVASGISDTLAYSLGYVSTDIYAHEVNKLNAKLASDNTRTGLVTSDILDASDLMTGLLTAIYEVLKNQETLNFIVVKSLLNVVISVITRRYQYDNPKFEKISPIKLQYMLGFIIGGVISFIKHARTRYVIEDGLEISLQLYLADVILELSGGDTAIIA